MYERKISIIDNQHKGSENFVEELISKLLEAGFRPLLNDAGGAELIIVVGGDGSFLRTLEQFGFPEVPFVGFNTGHLGFFQELQSDDADEFIERYLQGKFGQQRYRTVLGSIHHEGGVQTMRGLNEISIKAADAKTAHLDIYIGENLVEKFSGDGVVISTPAGSTAYNYALGGSIVDPRLELLQLTPIAPVNTTAYRSFTSGIVLPPGFSVRVFPDPDHAGDETGHETLVAMDGKEERFKSFRHIEIGLSEQSVTLLRFKNYEFWNTVKKKLLTL